MPPYGVVFQPTGTIIPHLFEKCNPFFEIFLIFFDFLFFAGQGRFLGRLGDSNFDLSVCCGRHNAAAVGAVTSCRSARSNQEASGGYAPQPRSASRSTASRFRWRNCSLCSHSAKARLEDIVRQKSRVCGLKKTANTLARSAAFVCSRFFNADTRNLVE